MGNGGTLVRVYAPGLRRSNCRRARRRGKGPRRRMDLGKRENHAVLSLRDLSRHGAYEDVLLQNGADAGSCYHYEVRMRPGRAGDCIGGGRVARDGPCLPRRLAPPALKRILCYAPRGRAVTASIS